MRPLSKQTKKILVEDKFMETCCIADFNCSGRIEWHHNLIYGHRQSDIANTILPVCNAHHKIADYKEVKEKLNWVMLNRMTEDEIRSVSKAIPYRDMRDRLNLKYGTYRS